MSKKLNFLPKSSFGSSNQLSRILHWLLTVGRYSVIFTELIVIVAFASRFKFDRDLNDLIEERERQLVILESYSTTEANLKLRQDQIKLGQSIILSQANPEAFLQALENSLAPNLKFEQIQIASDSAKLTGQSLTDLAVAQLTTVLIKSPGLESLSLDNFGNSQGGGLEFSISATRVQPSSSSNEK